MSAEPDAGEDGPARRRAPRPNLGAEIASAGRGLLAMAAGRPSWPGYFELSTAGFLRSFFAPALALPLYVLGSALVTRALTDGRPAPAAFLWSAGIAHVIDALAFPLLIALIARPLRIDKGYLAFIVTTNWGLLYLNGLLALGSLLALLGHDGLEAFSVATLGLLCLSVFFVWRAGRTTLSREVAPVLLVVVLWVAVSAAADAVVQLFA